MLVVPQKSKNICEADSACEISLLADAVLPVKTTDVKAEMVAWKAYVEHAVLPGEEPDTGTIRKCRKLYHSLSNTLFPSTPSQVRKRERNRVRQA